MVVGPSNCEVAFEDLNHQLVDVPRYPAFVVSSVESSLADDVAAAKFREERHGTERPEEFSTERDLAYDGSS